MEKTSPVHGGELWQCLPLFPKPAFGNSSHPCLTPGDDALVSNTPYSRWLSYESCAELSIELDICRSTRLARQRYERRRLLLGVAAVTIIVSVIAAILTPILVTTLSSKSEPPLYFSSCSKTKKLQRNGKQFMLLSQQQKSIEICFSSHVKLHSSEKAKKGTRFEQIDILIMM